VFLRLPRCRAARADGLKLSLHCAEVMNVRETLALLSVGPDRLGHMCVLVSGGHDVPQWHFRNRPSALTAPLTCR